MTNFIKNIVIDVNIDERGQGVGKLFLNESLLLKVFFYPEYNNDFDYAEETTNETFASLHHIFKKYAEIMYQEVNRLYDSIEVESWVNFPIPYARFFNVYEIPCEVFIYKENIIIDTLYNKGYSYEFLGLHNMKPANEKSFSDGFILKKGNLVKVEQEFFLIDFNSGEVSESYRVIYPSDCNIGELVKLYPLKTVTYESETKFFHQDEIVAIIKYLI